MPAKRWVVAIRRIMPERASVPAAMPVRSAGILLYRHGAAGLEVLLVHPGGPFWARRDAGAWSIPKGEQSDGEAAVDCARREFAEEPGSPLPLETLLPLGEIRLRSGKRV